MDLNDIFGVIKTHHEATVSGLHHGERTGMGKVVTEINRLSDLKGLSGDWHQGYRKALQDVRAYILAELKS